MTTATTEPQVKRGVVTVKPYIDQTVDNMGLQNYGLVLFDGVAHEEQLACVERNGVIQYITGLNEFASEVKLIADPEVKEAKVKQIRYTVSELEKALNSNVVDPEDPEFWNKIKLLRPDNNEFWGKISLRCTNEPLTLQPDKDPMDLIKFIAIEAGGFTIVAKSFEAARAMSVPPKFYLDKAVETAATKIEVKQLRNKALSELQKLFEKNTDKMFLIAKVVDGNSVQYKKKTPKPIIYDNMDRFINGQGVEGNQRRAAQTFLDACKLDMGVLKLKAMVKDATFYKFIATKGDGVIYHMNTGTMMGRNPSECVEFLNNPLNDKILEHLTQVLEEYWNN
jgi:hypothetical protein